jgi:hypothetical protein
MPLTSTDRQAGYDWRLSIWQMEVSLTQVFDRPVEGRKFFEEVIRDNLDLGRPDRVQLLFERRITKSTPGAFRTRVIQDGVSPSLHIEYRSFDLKQYFKEGRAHLESRVAFPSFCPCHLDPVDRQGAQVKAQMNPVIGAFAAWN